MPLPQKPPDAGFTPLTYFRLVCEQAQLLFTRREVHLLSLFAELTGDPQLIDGTVEAARQQYRQQLNTAQVVIDEPTLTLMEKRHLLYTRLQSGWVLFWICPLQTGWLVRAIWQYAVSSESRHLLFTIFYFIFITVIALCLVYLGFIVLALLSRPFYWLCARFISLPGIYEIEPLKKMSI